MERPRRIGRRKRRQAGKWAAERRAAYARTSASCLAVRPPGLASDGPSPRASLRPERDVETPRSCREPVGRRLPRRAACLKVEGSLHRVERGNRSDIQEFQ